MKFFLIISLLVISIFANEKPETITTCIQKFDLCEDSCSGTCSLDGSSEHTCFKSCRVIRDECIKKVLSK